MTWIYTKEKEYMLVLKKGSNESIENDKDDDATQDKRKLLKGFLQHADKLKFYYEVDNKR